ncbi:MAG: hypothetical protein LAP21_23220 [Acidobacteriia bacterium]|nr:hypothetical protein [Terriglobia bacterium]
MNTRLSSRLLLLFIFAIASTVGQEPPHAAAQNRHLSAKAGVGAQQYCQGDSHTFTVYFTLDLTLVNQSKTDVVLARKVKIPTVRVSATLADAQAKHFFYNPDPYYVSTRPPTELNFGAVPDPALFIVLKPGEEYRTTQWTGILANLTTKKRKGRSGVTAGNYVAQVLVNTWPFETVPGPEIVKSWSKIGPLSNEIVESAFFPLALPVVKNAESCRTFRAPE